MIAFAIRRAHWLLISMSVRPVGSTKTYFTSVPGMHVAMHIFQCQNFFPGTPRSHRCRGQHEKNRWPGYQGASVRSPIRCGATAMPVLQLRIAALMATARMRSQVNSVRVFTLTESLQNAAVSYRLTRTALLAKFFQLPLQRLQFFNAERHMTDVPVE
jgi:hypothetical protein